MRYRYFETAIKSDSITKKELAVRKKLSPCLKVLNDGNEIAILDEILFGVMGNTKILETLLPKWPGIELSSYQSWA
jgi:hypothetical protein